MKKERKTFKVNIGGIEKELCFKNPNQEELLALDLEYRKVFSQCLREGIISEAEAKKIAEKNGVWTREDEKQISTLAFEIGLLESIVRNEDKKSTEKQIEESIVKLSERRSDLISLINRKVEVVSNSAEGLASQQRMHKFVQLCCVLSNDTNRLFNDIESYESFAQNEPEILSEIYKQAYFHEFGDPDNLTKEWPEIKYLKNKVEEAKKEQEAKEPSEAEPKKPGRKKKDLVSADK